MSNPGCLSQYKAMRQKVYEKYGTEHLCGNCIHTTTCIRAKIQWLNRKSIKKELMKEKAQFVKSFDIEPLGRWQKDVGFVVVYDCENFEFDIGER